MKIAFDVSPLQTGHKVRGVGFYIKNLKKSLLKYHPENEYIFFSNKNEIKEKVDIIHYPYFEPFFLTLPLLEKYKRVITVHDLTPILFPEHFPAGIKGNIRWNIQKNILKKSNAIITDSYISQKDIARILKINKSKIDVAYLAAAEEFRQLEVGKWRQEIINKYNLPEKFVLYVGDITWNKNIPALIRAVKKINLTLVIIGKAISETNPKTSNLWNKDLLKVREDIEADKRFIPLGFVSDEDLVRIYNLATVFVFPSLYEGFGLPILEAMQSGCPVVLSKNLKEIGGSAPFYINPNNINDIANGIGEVFFSTKTQSELAKKGLERSKDFTWQKTATDTVNTYKKTLD